MVKRKKVLENGGAPASTTFDSRCFELKDAAGSDAVAGSPEAVVGGGESGPGGTRSAIARHCKTPSVGISEEPVVCSPMDSAAPPSIDPAKKGTAGTAVVTVGPTLRSSSRVPKRPRQDTSPTPKAQTVVAKKGEAGTSASTKSGTTPEPGKTRRSWELWSKDDTKSFFEGLYEFGKDFESIQSFIVQKNRKKNHPPQLIKNKDQVRHFYYRTWHKISKHLKISDDVKKHVQELYGLINFGELRKKFFGRLDPKNGQKLNELVHTGSTIIRCKGKNFRVKTPVCRALKKLNSIKDPRDEDIPKLPMRINLELRPRTNGSWTRVQGIAQNPRLRMVVGLQRRLLTVLNYLQERWRTPENKQREALERLLQSSDPEATDEVPFDHVRRQPEQVLRLTPRKTDNLHLVSMAASSEGQCGVNVSLQRYRHKIQCLGDFVVNAGGGAAGGAATLKKGAGSKGRGAKSAAMTTDDSKKAVASDVAAVAPAENRPWSGIEQGWLKDPVVESDSCVSAGSKNDSAVGSVDLPTLETVASLPGTCPEESNSLPVHEVTLRQLAALETPLDAVVDTDKVFFKKARRLVLCDVRHFANDSTGEERLEEEQRLTNIWEKKESEQGDFPLKEVSEPVETQDDVQQQLDRIRRGWTLDDCGTLTVGEIYLMLGSPAKIVLEYEWVDTTPGVSDEGALSQSAVTAVHTGSAAITAKEAAQHVTVLLRQLIHLASTSFADLSKSKQERLESQSQQPCRCTHHCCPTSGTTRSAASKGGGGGQLKSPSGVRGSAKATKVSAARCAAQLAASVTCEPDGGGGPAAAAVVAAALPNVEMAATDGFRRVSLAPGHRGQVSMPGNQSEQMIAEKAFKEQLDKLLPQHRKTKTRMRKSAVVQRELPLLPKRPPVQPMMTLRLVPNDPQLSSSYMPMMSATACNITSPKVTRMVRLGPATTVATLIGSPMGTFKMPGPVTSSGNVTLTQVAPPVSSGVSQTTATFIVSSAGITSTCPPTIVVSTSAMSTTAGSASPLLTGVASTTVRNSSGAALPERHPAELESMSYMLRTADLRLPGSSLDLGDSGCKQEPSTSHQPPSLTPSGDRLLKVPPASSIADIALMEAGVTSPGLSIPPPPNISSLLDMSLTLPDGVSSCADNGNLGDVSTDKLLDITNSDSVFSGLMGLSSTASLMKAANDSESMPLSMPTLSGDVGGLDHRPSTPINSSPTSSLYKLSSPILEGHWLNGEVSDFSLSNFLSHLESPVKPGVSAPNATVSTDSTYAEPNFQCLISESSIDYIAKFEDFAAAQMSSGGTGPKSST